MSDAPPAASEEDEEAVEQTLDVGRTKRLVTPALLAALWSTTGGHAFLQVLGARWDDFWSFVVGIVT